MTMLSFIDTIFSTKKTPNNQSNNSTNLKSLSDSIQHIKTIISSQRYDEKALKQECRNCLRNCGKLAKATLADLALELKHVQHQTTIATDIFSVFDEVYSGKGSHSSFYSSPKGLKIVADQQDCVTAKYLYGIKLQVGDGVKEDIAGAFKYLAQAVESGHPLAIQFFLGIAHEIDQYPQMKQYAHLTQPAFYVQKAQDYFSKGMSVDAKQQLEWAALLPEGAKEIVNLAKKFESGSDSGPKDIDIALICYGFAAELNDLEAKFCVIKIEADKGDAGQQALLAKLYFYGDPDSQYPAQDVSKGSYYLGLALKQEQPDAAFLAAELYLNGYLIANKLVEDSSLLNLESRNPALRVFNFLLMAKNGKNEAATEILAILEHSGCGEENSCLIWSALLEYPVPEHEVENVINWLTKTSEQEKETNKYQKPLIALRQQWQQKCQQLSGESFPIQLEVKEEVVVSPRVTQQVEKQNTDSLMPESTNTTETPDLTNIVSNNETRDSTETGPAKEITESSDKQKQPEVEPIIDSVTTESTNNTDTPDIQEEVTPETINTEIEPVITESSDKQKQPDVEPIIDSVTSELTNNSDTPIPTKAIQEVETRETINTEIDPVITESSDKQKQPEVEPIIDSVTTESTNNTDTPDIQEEVTPETINTEIDPVITKPSDKQKQPDEEPIIDSVTTEPTNNTDTLNLTKDIQEEVTLETINTEIDPVITESSDKQQQPVGEHNIDSVTPESTNNTDTPNLTKDIQEEVTPETINTEIDPVITKLSDKQKQPDEEPIIDSVTAEPTNNTDTLNLTKDIQEEVTLETINTEIDPVITESSDKQQQQVVEQNIDSVTSESTNNTNTPNLTKVIQNKDTVSLSTPTKFNTEENLIIKGTTRSPAQEKGNPWSSPIRTGFSTPIRPGFSKQTDDEPSSPSKLRGSPLTTTGLTKQSKMRMYSENELGEVGKKYKLLQKNKAESESDNSLQKTTTITTKVVEEKSPDGQEVLPPNSETLQKHTNIASDKKDDSTLINVAIALSLFAGASFSIYWGYNYLRNKNS
jgi:TPR repeat protein